MIKRIVKMTPWGSHPLRDDFLHCLAVADNALTVRTLIRQASGITRPGNGNVGDGLYGGDLSPRLDGMMFKEMPSITVDWDPATMITGTLFLICTKYDGSPADPPYRIIELDALAALATHEARVKDGYPHWYHKTLCHHLNMVWSIGAAIVPVARVIIDAAEPAGFDDCRIDCWTTELGAFGAWDPDVAENNVIVRDTRYVLRDGSLNPDYDPRIPCPPMPEGWEYG